MMRKIIFCILLLVCMLSCSDNVDPFKPNTYIGAKLILSEQLSMLSFSNQRVLVFLDVEECSSCKLKELQFWDSILYSLADCHVDSNLDFDVVFVVNAIENEELSTMFARESEIFPVKVFYDSNNSFKSNNVLPVEEQYHCFLIDRRNRIELIGNPIYSTELSDKYFDRILR